MSMFELGLTTMLLSAAIGYLLGSIPSGVILARVMGLGNLRDIGSGNIGATNVLRTGNKKAAALTLLFDALKAVVAVLLARSLAGEGATLIAGFAALLGHCFPVWLRFKGGKGVATYFGVLFAMSWPIGILAALIWLGVAAISRYSSLAALVTVGWVPLVTLLWADSGLSFLSAALAVVIFLRHLSNIKRLREGTETKIGAKKPAV